MKSKIQAENIIKKTEQILFETIKTKEDAAKFDLDEQALRYARTLFLHGGAAETPGLNTPGTTVKFYHVPNGTNDRTFDRVCHFYELLGFNVKREGNLATLATTYDHWQNLYFKFSDEVSHDLISRTLWENTVDFVLIRTIFPKKILKPYQTF